MKIFLLALSGILLFWRRSDYYTCAHCKRRNGSRYVGGGNPSLQYKRKAGPSIPFHGSYIMSTHLCLSCFTALPSGTVAGYALQYFVTYENSCSPLRGIDEPAIRRNLVEAAMYWKGVRKDPPYANEVWEKIRTETLAA